MGNFTIRSGDSYTGNRRITITVLDEDGAPVDVSSTAMTFMVKRRRLDEDAVFTAETPTDIEIASPQSGATKGKAYLTIESTDTDSLSGDYMWELEGEDAQGIITLAGGRLIVKEDLIAP